MAISFLFAPKIGAAETTQDVAKEFAVGSPPAWVKPVVAANLEDKSISSSDTEGTHFLLLDYQSNAGIHENYSHVVKKIINQNGVQNGASLQFNFEPAFEKLTIHFIHIIRDGRTMDRLEPHKFKVIQQESRLERHLFNGSLKAVLFLEDVRVGDIVEYACTRKGSNPIFKDHYLNDYAVEWSVPVAQEYLRVVCPVEKQLYIKNHKTALLPTITEANGIREYIWQAREIPAVLLEESTPSWFEAFGWVQLTDFSSWREVAEWARPLYETNHSPLPQDLQQKITVWRQEQTPEERARQALRFVQDEVRYLGIEVGPNSHQPNDPALVFSRRFGDCKDKSLLFCTILKEMDIEAHPVLVHSYNNSSVDSWAPSPYAFNHVIAQVKLNGKTLWFDPTLSNQRGPLTNLYFPDYGRGLVITAESADLTVIPAQKTGLPLIAIDETFRIANYSNEVIFDPTTVRQGHDADHMRAELTRTRKEELQKSYLNHYAKLYPKIKIGAPMEIHDDEERNVLTIREHYRIASIWDLSEDKQSWTCDFWPEDIEDLASKPDISLRSMPLDVPCPLHRKQITHVLLPDDYSIENESTNISGKAMRLTRTVTYAKRELTMQYDFETLTNAVAVTDMPAHLETLKRIRDTAGYSIQRPVNSAAAPSSPNWPIIALTAVFSALMIPAMVLAYHFRPRNKQPPPLDADPELTGIAGWLVLVAIGLALKPWSSLLNIGKILKLCSQDSWQALTTPGTVSYSPHWAPMLFFELFSNLAFFAFSIVLNILFFQKRFAARSYCIGLLAASLVFKLVDHAWVSMIKTSTSSKSIIPTMVGMVLGTTIWILYFLLSRRVKNTFTQ